MAQAPRDVPTPPVEVANFKQVVYVGVGVDRGQEILTTEAFFAKHEAVDELLENGCTPNSIRIFEVDYDLRLHSTNDIPLTRLEVR